MENLRDLLFSEKDGIATLTLNRARSMNSLTLELLKEINLALKECRRRDDIRVVILTGAGNAFSSGANIFGFEEALRENRIKSLVEEMVIEVNNLVIAVREILKPVLAMVNGFAFGAALDLLQACDFIFASKGAKFQVGFPRFGLIPDGGGTYFFSRKLGVQKANELIFAAEPISAQKAFDMGLVNSVCADNEELRAKTMETALRLAKGSAAAFAMTKKLINESTFKDLKEHLLREKNVQGERCMSPDFGEGLRALIEKREPDFE